MVVFASFDKKSLYRRVAVLDLQEVLPLIRIGRWNAGSSGKIKAQLHGYEVTISSLRLVTFRARGIECCRCGLKASYFAIEANRLNFNYHLNLYGIDHRGKERMLTMDHIIPVSKGGQDCLANSQTMCAPCNFKKSNKIEQLCLPAPKTEYIGIQTT